MGIFDQYFPRHHHGIVDDVRNMIEKYVFHDEQRLTELVSTTKKAIAIMFSPPIITATISIDYRNGITETHSPGVLEDIFIKLWPYVYSIFGLSFNHHLFYYEKLYKNTSILYYNLPSISLLTQLHKINPNGTFSSKFASSGFTAQFLCLLDKWRHEESYFIESTYVWEFTSSLFVEDKTEVYYAYRPQHDLFMFPRVDFILDPYMFSKLKSIMSFS